MSVIATIKKANAEYEQNGRSEQFVAFEDGIVKSKNMVHVYWFARYVKGADIGKLQSIILRNGSMEDCFYLLNMLEGLI